MAEPLPVRQGARNHCGTRGGLHHRQGRIRCKARSLAGGPKGGALGPAPRTSRSWLRSSDPRTPVGRPATTVGESPDQYPTFVNSVDNTEWESAEQAPACALRKARPCIRKPHNVRFGRVNLV